MKNYLVLNNEVLNTYKTTGFIDREKDKEATRDFFFEEINRKTMFFHTLEEKINYLKREGYYETEFLDKYSFKFIKKIFQIAYSYKFRFPTFMSASKFYSSYALKTRDGNNFLERYEDRMAIVALYLAQGNRKYAENWIHYLMRSYQPATPTFINVGKKARGEFVSCFKISMADSMNSIAHNIGNALQLSKIGGGVGGVKLMPTINFVNLW